MANIEQTASQLEHTHPGERSAAVLQHDALKEAKQGLQEQQRRSLEGVKRKEFNKAKAEYKKKKATFDAKLASLYEEKGKLQHSFSYDNDRKMRELYRHFTTASTSDLPKLQTYVDQMEQAYKEFTAAGGDGAKPMHDFFETEKIERERIQERIAQEKMEIRSIYGKRTNGRINNEIEFEDKNPELIKYLTSKRNETYKENEAFINIYRIKIRTIREMADTAFYKINAIEEDFKEAAKTPLGDTSLPAQKLRDLYRNLTEARTVGVEELQTDLDQMEQSCETFESTFQSEMDQSTLVSRLVRAIKQPLRDFVQAERGREIEQIQTTLAQQIRFTENEYFFRTGENIENAIQREDARQTERAAPEHNRPVGEQASSESRVLDHNALRGARRGSHEQQKSFFEAMKRKARRKFDAVKAKYEKKKTQGLSSEQTRPVSESARMLDHDAPKEAKQGLQEQQRLFLEGVKRKTKNEFHRAKATYEKKKATFDAKLASLHEEKGKLQHSFSYDNDRKMRELYRRFTTASTSDLPKLRTYVDQMEQAHKEFTAAVFALSEQPVSQHDNGAKSMHETVETRKSQIKDLEERITKEERGFKLSYQEMTKVNIKDENGNIKEINSNIKEDTEFEDSNSQLIEYLISKRENVWEEHKGFLKPYREKSSSLKNRADTALYKRNAIEEDFNKAAKTLLGDTSLPAQKLRDLYRNLTEARTVGVEELQTDLNQIEQSCETFESTFQSEMGQSTLVSRLVRAVKQPLRDFVQQEREREIEQIQRTLAQQMRPTGYQYSQRTGENIEDAIQREDARQTEQAASEHTDPVGGQASSTFEGVKGEAVSEFHTAKAGYESGKEALNETFVSLYEGSYETLYNDIYLKGYSNRKIRELHRRLSAMMTVDVPKLQADVDQMEQSYHKFTAAADGGAKTMHDFVETGKSEIARMQERIARRKEACAHLYLQKTDGGIEKDIEV